MHYIGYMLNLQWICMDSQHIYIVESVNLVLQGKLNAVFLTTLSRLWVYLKTSELTDYCNFCQRAHTHIYAHILH